MSDVLNTVSVFYDSNNTTLNTPLALSADALGVPRVAAAYNANASAFTAQTLYAANVGTVTFSRACFEGISGTIDGASLVEVSATTLGVVPGGCTIQMPASVSFDFGDPCP